MFPKAEPIVGDDVRRTLTGPKPVRGVLVTFSHKVVERQSVQRWNEGRLIYELHLENANEIVKAQFAEDGVVLSQSTKPRPEKKK